MKKKTSNKFVRIGKVGVDSGQLMVCDPCYIGSEWKKTEYGETDDTSEFSYAGICAGTLKQGFTQSNFKMGHAGAGVAFSSGYGDGCYPVYARCNSDGRIVEVKIKMG